MPGGAVAGVVGVGAGPGGGGGEDLLTVTVIRDDHGYGMKVSGDNPVYVQSVKEHGAAWRAGLRAGDRIMCVDGAPVHDQAHQTVVHMIRANPSTVLTVQPNTHRHITAPLPVNQEKQRQVEVTKVKTVRLMLDNERKYIWDLKNELSKVPDVRKQAQLELAEQRCAKLQQEIDNITASQPAYEAAIPAPRTPRSLRPDAAAASPQHGFLSGLPRSLSNLTGQSLRNLRQARLAAKPVVSPPLLRQSSDESPAAVNKRWHNNTVPLVPTTCLDNAPTPPPLPPRRDAFKAPPPPSVQRSLRRSSQSLDGGDRDDGPRPNSIAMQMSYPLINVPPPPLQLDSRTGAPVVLHARSLSSPEQLDHTQAPPFDDKDVTPPPGTPPPPYAHNTQPCADPQRAIISMEEDDSTASDNSTSLGVFSSLRDVKESRARMAVLLNWLLGERRCACSCLLLLITDGYRSATGVSNATLRRWAYEIQSTFLMPNAVLALSNVDENIANEIEQILSNDYDKDEILRNVFRKARQKAKEDLTNQLTEFQRKRQVGLGTLYGPEDSVLLRCDADKAQELVVVERLVCGSIRAVAGGAARGCGTPGAEAHQALLAALVATAHCLHARPQTIAAAAGGNRASFLLRDKHYKQRLKQLTKQLPQPFIVRGHHLSLQAMTSVSHCHHCDNVIWGLAPQAYVCTDCKLRVHRGCARAVEEPCCLDVGDQHGKRISRFMERIQQANPGHQDTNEKKSRKASSTSHFLNMERSFRKIEDEQPWDHAPLSNNSQERRDESDESLYESADCHSDAISASDDALPRLSTTPTLSKESLKIAVTDEETDLAKNKKCHRKTMSLSNPLEMVRSLGDEWFETTKKDLDKHSDKKKSRESLWSEDDREATHGSTVNLRKNSKNEDKNSRKSSSSEISGSRKSGKSSSVSALNFLRRRKTPSAAIKPVESVAEVVDKVISIEEVLNYTKFFLEEEKRHSSLYKSTPVSEETDSEEEPPTTPKAVIVNGDHRRRLSRQTSRSKSKARGKSQTVNVNTLRKSHSGTLKKAKKKNAKTPIAGRSRQASIVEPTPILKKKFSQATKQNSWLFSSTRGEPRRDGSAEETSAPDGAADADAHEHKDQHHDKDNSWRHLSAGSGARGVNRAESCREREGAAAHARRGKQRNASDPNRLTAAHNNNDLEASAGPGAAPSGSSSSSSLSSRSNESNTAAADHAWQSEWSEEEDPLAAQWADSVPQHVIDDLDLSPRHRKRQEVIHELIVSEGSHVRWLRVLGCVFLRPLERGEHAHLLSAEELRALFPNLPAVLERHARLHQALKQLRVGQQGQHIVHIRPLADAVLQTLGEPGYAACVSRFCRGQRMALEALRERRRKSKELHQFLAAREQLPLCGRLQLRDLIACAWQRLTKYQLLLENILKTVADEDSESEEDVARLKMALDTAKEVLHGVDTAIRTAENEHRLRTVQSKLEVRVGSSAGGEFEELRRFDLTQHTLRTEGELCIRTDTKRISVLALMLEDCLVLLQREGERFQLKPIPQPSQLGLLSPIVRWSTVLFRPNAAVRNTFFLMNLNGVQMHELSANTPAEYTMWCKYIAEAPLADARTGPALVPAAAAAAAAQRTNDDTASTGVARNPSDASERSGAASADHTDVETDVAATEPAEQTSAAAAPVIPSPSPSPSPSPVESDKHKLVPRRPTMGRISTHGPELTAPLEPSGAVVVHPPAAEQRAHTATRAYAPHERLRRLDEDISRAMRAKSRLVAELLAVPVDSYGAVAELAVAEALGHVDIDREMRLTEESAGGDTAVGPEGAEGEASSAPDVHQLLLAAQAQANHLTVALTRALSVSESAIIAARGGAGAGAGASAPAAGGPGRGTCDTCARRRAARRTSTLNGDQATTGALVAAATTHDESESKAAELSDSTASSESTASLGGDSARSALPAAQWAAGAGAEDASAEPLYQRLAEVGADGLPHSVSFEDIGETSTDPIFGGGLSSGGEAVLASRLVGVACGLQATLARLLIALPTAEAHAHRARSELAAQRDANDALRSRLRHERPPSEPSNPDGALDAAQERERASNGG